MRVLHSFSDLATIHHPIHWAMGVFDGVHLGHQFIIESAQKAKQHDGGLLGVFTFDRHPLQIVNPQNAPELLLTNEREKEDILRQLGVEIMLNLHFTKEIAEMPPEEFIDELMKHAPIGSISVGDDWKFGKDRKGNTTMLEQEGRERGFSVYAHPHVFWNGERISSTRIRKHLSDGDMHGVCSMLGRPYSITGSVIHGMELGRQINFPTANIRLENGQNPPPGVYAVNVHIEGALFNGVANIGYRPTVEQDAKELLLEAHIFDWNGNLYGKAIQVDLIKFIRREQQFESLEALKQQIEDDCLSAKEILSRSL